MPETEAKKPTQSKMSNQNGLDNDFLSSYHNDVHRPCYRRDKTFTEEIKQTERKPGLDESIETKECNRYFLQCREKHEFLATITKDLQGTSNKECENTNLISIKPLKVVKNDIDSKLMTTNYIHARHNSSGRRKSGSSGIYYNLDKRRKVIQGDEITSSNLVVQSPLTISDKCEQNLDKPEGLRNILNYLGDVNENTMAIDFANTSWSVGSMNETPNGHIKMRINRR